MACQWTCSHRRGSSINWETHGHMSKPTPARTQSSVTDVTGMCIPSWLSRIPDDAKWWVS